jgi:uncharacterized protein (TIGR02145 family)
MTFVTQGQAPIVSVSSATNINSTIATLNGNVNPNSLSTTVIFEYGTTLSYGNIVTASPSPINGSSPVSFTAHISGLIANITYYVRAIATNSMGTSYSNELSFKTLFPNCGTVTDIDGNVYNTVIIGDRCYMQENLKTTRFNDGTEIRLVSDNSSSFDQHPWIEFPENTAYCWYNYDIRYKDIYGALYNSKATGSGILCPVGWHVSSAGSHPSSIPVDDWHNMLRLFDPNADAEYLQGSAIAGGALKATGTTEEGTGLWHYPNTGATNESGFTALPGGSCSGEVFHNNVFSGLGEYGAWWTVASETRSVSYRSTGVGASETTTGGRSVRCVKD